MNRVFGWVDSLLSGTAVGRWLNNKKTVIGVLGYLLIWVLHATDVITAEQGMEYNGWISGWTGIAIIHKTAKAGK